MTRNNMVSDLPKLDHVEQLCETCIRTKHRCVSFPTKAKYRIDAPLDLVHGALCGPVSPATPRGHNYFLLLIENDSRFMWLELLSSKSDTATAIKKLKGIAKNQSSQLAVIICDCYTLTTVASSPPMSSRATARSRTWRTSPRHTHHNRMMS
jgi:hypothetical protein